MILSLHTLKSEGMNNMLRSPHIHEPLIKQYMENIKNETYIILSNTAIAKIIHMAPRIKQVT